MGYSISDVLDYVIQEDVKFIRLAFCDLNGKHKNISIMPQELPRAFKHGIAIDASLVDGFERPFSSFVYLFPDSETLQVLPWRPNHGKVVRIFCSIMNQDGSEFELDSRNVLMSALIKAKENDLNLSIGSEFLFYLFKLDENGNPTKAVFDQAGYMDIAPEDKGENLRREVCLTLELMDILPERSHHEKGPSQHKIDIKASSGLSVADNVLTFKWVAKTVADRNGLIADFATIANFDFPFSGMNLNFKLGVQNKNLTDSFIAGICSHFREILLFLNPNSDDFKKINSFKEEGYSLFTNTNKKKLIDVLEEGTENERVLVSLIDGLSNPYLSIALLIEAGLDGILKGIKTDELMKENLLGGLPENITQAKAIASKSEFLKSRLPSSIISFYCK